MLLLDFSKRPIIAVIYLKPLLGYAEHPGINRVIDYALEDLEILKKAGVDAALLENENDRPYTLKASKEVIASMSVVAAAIQRQAGTFPIGSEFLINDPHASLAIAKSANNSFIRTDYFVDRMARQEYGGEIEIDPQGILDYRKKIAATDIQLLTDIQVKYATMLEDKTLAESARQAQQFQSSAAVVSAELTGVAPAKDTILQAKEGAPELPILVGSGLNHSNLEELYPLIDGAIVGTALMSDQRMDYEKAAPFMDIVRNLR